MINIVLDKKTIDGAVLTDFSILYFWWGQVSCDTKTEIDKVKLKHYVKNLTNFASKIHQKFTIIDFHSFKESILNILKLDLFFTIS